MKIYYFYMLCTKGTVIIYQAEGLENLRGVKFFLYRYCGGQFLKPLSLGAVNLSLKHLVVKKKVKVTKKTKQNK